MPKAQKWTDETVVQLVEGYRKDDSDMSVAELMEALGKSKREIVGKLASLKEYVIPEKPTRKTPVDTRPSKKELVKQLEDAGFTSFKGMEGATKDALIEVIDLVVPASE